jgi:hypothetical protein
MSQTNQDQEIDLSIIAKKINNIFDNAGKLVFTVIQFYLFPERFLDIL